MEGTAVLIIAHRGASAAAPENTLEAYALARDLGADWVELDVRRSADGAAVVHHDAHLPDGRVIVETPSTELPATVPSLAAALDGCEGMGVNIEIKNSRRDPDHDPSERVAAMVVEEVRRRSCQDRVLVSSFSMATVDRVRELDATVPTGFLVFDPGTADVSTLVARTARHGHGALHPWDGLVSAELVEAARRERLAVNVWTVDDPSRMAELMALGVDGLVTNVPDVGRRVVGGAG